MTINIKRVGGSVGKGFINSNGSYRSIRAERKARALESFSSMFESLAYCTETRHYTSKAALDKVRISHKARRSAHIVIRELEAA